jgi:hypothetical protein
MTSAARGTASIAGALGLLAEAELMMRHEALRTLVREEQGESVREAPIVGAELKRLGMSVPRQPGQQPPFDISQQETAQRLGYWWGKLRKLVAAA